MLSIDEELEAAKAVKGAIHTLLAKAPSREILPMLRDARDAATRAMIFLGEGPLNDARDEIGTTLSILIRALEK
jgi:hypothetical protein